jgi:NAD(P)-dependent dehydrogenase (short-subunit alcohol dehydrogenase family)
MSSKKIILFGHTGDIGKSCLELLNEHNYNVLCVPRNKISELVLEKVDGAIWAQGANLTETFENTSTENWDSIWDANFNYLVKTLNYLLSNDLLNKNARLVALSSVWQEIARSNKSAYISSKAALGGLVRALAVDLGPKGIAINAILPGVTESAMTSRNLSVDQISEIRETTPTGKLVELSQIASVIEFLVSNKSIGINGQSIFVDNGWSQTKNV